MRFPFYMALFAVGLSFFAIGARGQSPITLIAANTSNTGQDGNGNLLAAGAQDPLWQLVGYDNSYGFNNITFGPPTSTSNSVPHTIPEASYVVQNPPAPWAKYPGAAQFVSATPNQNNGGMPGTFIYEFSFNSPVSGTVTFSGTASADNGLRIVYNGVTEATFGGQLVLSTDPSWTNTINANTPAGGSVYGQAAAPFNFSAPITAGTNTIDFYVSNFNDAAYTGDEEALAVTNFAITAVPEPSQSAGLLFLLAAVVILVRKMRPKARTIS